MSKRLEFLHARYESHRHGPQGESRSRSIAEWTHPIPIEKIICETDFSNIRLKPAENEIEFLADSMFEEGLKVPITVSEGRNGAYFLRAGFRRVAAARRLAWTFIPAIVLPMNTPKVSEHWANIIENTARNPLRTYEIANAALIMKRDFNVDTKTFARKADQSRVHHPHGQGHREPAPDDTRTLAGRREIPDRLVLHLVHHAPRGDPGLSNWRRGDGSTTEQNPCSQPIIPGQRRREARCRLPRTPG